MKSLIEYWLKIIDGKKYGFNFVQFWDQCEIILPVIQGDFIWSKLNLEALKMFGLK